MKIPEWLRIFNEEERIFFKTVRESNRFEVIKWNFVNLILPLILIAFTLFLVVLQHKILSKEFFSPILNGSLILIAINLLAIGAFTIIKFNQQKESELGLKNDGIRFKLIASTLVILLFCVGIYVYQTSFSSIYNIELREQIIITIVSLSLIFSSYYISNHLLLVQEHFIERTFSGLNYKSEKTMTDDNDPDDFLSKK